jgi:ADP-ribosylglycohydrolase
MTDRAKKSNWKTRDAPEKRESLGYDSVFTDADAKRLRLGLIPQAMEDKWFVYFENGWLFLHRSWTGSLIYWLRLEEGPGEVRVVESWVNRDAEQYRETDIVYDRLLLDFLLRRMLLGQNTAFPVRLADNASYSLGVYQHNIVGRAYPERTVFESSVNVKMLGAIPGDIVGSVFEGRKQWMLERNPHFDPLFARNAKFTDDTVLTIAITDYILNSRDLVDTLKAYANTYPKAGYGKSFKKWACGDAKGPYSSYGNGGAMRVSPIAYAYKTLDEVLYHAKLTASVTHNHSEGIKGAQAIAAAIFLARTGATKSDICHYISGQFNYRLDDKIENIRWTYTFDSSSQGTVPQAIIAALESTDYENAIRLAVSLGGDCDTIASMAGAVAAALYGGVPEWIAKQAVDKLDEHLTKIHSSFVNQYGV